MLCLERKEGAVPVLADLPLFPVILTNPGSPDKGNLSI